MILFSFLELFIQIKTKIEKNNENMVVDAGNIIFI